MEKSLNNRDRRSHPRLVVDLPLEYQEMCDPCLRGGLVVNVSEGGLLIETVRDIPVGEELNITVLFPKRFELADLKVMARIVRKERCVKQDWKGNRYWEGYRYGLEFVHIPEEDRWKLNWLLGEEFRFEEFQPSRSRQPEELR